MQNLMVTMSCCINQPDYSITYRVWNPHDLCGGVGVIKGALGCELGTLLIQRHNLYLYMINHK